MNLVGALGVLGLVLGALLYSFGGALLVGAVCVVALLVSSAGQRRLGP